MKPPKPSEHELAFFNIVYEKHYLQIHNYGNRIIVSNYRTGKDETIFDSKNKPIKVKYDKGKEHTFIEIFCK